MSNQCEVYITVDNYEKKKSCCVIKVSERDNQDEILIVPNYSKYYFGEKQRANYHTTRHYSFLHRTLYLDGKKVSTQDPLFSYGDQIRPPLDQLTDYEVIDCFQVSPVILDREITKDYNKQNKLEIILTAYENQYYQIYIFVSPLEHCALYNDLQKHNIEFFIFKRRNYEIVIAVENKAGINTTAICNCLNMYNSIHKNNGIGFFKPI